MDTEKKDEKQEGEKEEMELKTNFEVQKRMKDEALYEKERVSPKIYFIVSKCQNLGYFDFRETNLLKIENGMRRFPAILAQFPAILRTRFSSPTVPCAF